MADRSVARNFVQLPKRQIILTMVGVLLALFLSALDQTIVATAMPRIIADLGGFDRLHVGDDGVPRGIHNRRAYRRTAD